MFIVRKEEEEREEGEGEEGEGKARRRRRRSGAEESGADGGERYDHRRQ